MIGADGCTYRRGGDTFGAVFRKINNESPNDSPIELAASRVGEDVRPRGIKRKWHRLSPPAGDYADQPVDLDGAKLIYAIRALPLLKFGAAGCSAARALKYGGARGG